MPPTSLSRGQRLPLAPLLDPARPLVVGLRFDAAFAADFACFGVDAQGRLLADPYMVFYNQPATPCGGLRLASGGTGTDATFAVDLARLPAGLERLVFTAVVDGADTLRALRAGRATLDQEGAHGAGLEYAFGGAEFADEKALMLFELYRRDGNWRVAALGQGFNGGLAALLAHFGGEAAPEPAGASAPTAPAAPAAPAMPVAAPAVSLTKRARLEKDLATQAPQLVSLVKSAGVVLEKKGLADHRAKVALVLDVSGSMHRLYSQGVIQRVVERLLALACLFDDDRQLDVVLFDNRAIGAGEVGPATVAGAVERWLRAYGLGGGTDYAPAMRLVERTLDRAVLGSGRLPVYVLFVTDGAPGDRAASQKALRELSGRPVFWQFVGVGGGRFDFLEKLDDLTGRVVDNADFFALPDPSRMADDDLYARLMNEYPGWLRAAQGQGWI